MLISSYHYTSHHIFLPRQAVAASVASAMPSEVHCGLLLVQTTELKQALLRKADALVSGVCGLVVAELERQAAELTRAYDVIHTHLQARRLTYLDIG